MYTIKSRIWIEGKSGTFLANGRIDLLKRIDEYGSISKAAKAMEMSYKKAWNLIDSMNAQAKEPLIVRSTGGKNGGGTTLTNEGRRIIKAFEKLSDKYSKHLDKEFEKSGL